jgi:hypothetical protein
MSGADAGKGLIAARAALGVTAIAAPRVIVRVLGLRPEANADYAYLLRIFGTREVFVAAMSAGVGGSSASTLMALRLGMAVDSVDMMALWLAYRSGRAHPAALTVLTVLGVAAVGMGYLASADARRNSAVVAAASSNGPVA